MKNNNTNEKYFAIGINATKDINPCQKLEVLNTDGDLVLLDSFETFFKDSDSAKSKYTDIFNFLKTSSKNKDSTKFTIFSHITNVSDIRAGKTKDFVISIVQSEGDNPIRYNLGELLSKEAIQERLSEQGLGNINLDNCGLEGIINGNDEEGYIYIFNSGTGGGTHNIASTLLSFSESIKSRWFKIVAPNCEDETREYTARTSLFYQEDKIKYCIRTDANKQQIDIVDRFIDINKLFISDILFTDRSTSHLKGIGLHSVPTKFDENVLHNALTVVFNCEDREMGEVIDAVIGEATELLLKIESDFVTSTYLSNLLKSLIFLKNKLDIYNEFIFDKKIEINFTRKNKQKYENKYKKEYIEKENKKGRARIDIVDDDIINLGIKRIKVLKEILPTLVEMTKISENMKEKKDKDNNPESDLGRVVLITDGSEGAVGSIETDNHEIFFLNSIWEIGDYEEIFFEKLKKLSKGQIDIDITDTTGCGDSSTASALMIRENLGLDIRKEKYVEILKEMGVPKESYNRAIAITEAYFLSHLQEVVSGTVYRCKKSNLGDIPNSNKISKMILLYVYRDTLEFIKKGMKSFIYSLDNSIVTEGRVYNGFEVFKIS